MSIKWIFITILFIFHKSNIRAQEQSNMEHISSNISKILSNGLLQDKIKDSTAIYANSIVINVDIQKRQQIVTLISNNHFVDRFFNGLDSLKKIDYSLLMGKRRTAKFIFKIYIIVSDSKYNPHLIDIEEIYKSVNYLFVRDELRIQNLGSIVLKLDKKIYH